MKAGTRTLWTFAITSIALFMVVLDNLVVSTALPVIRVDLGATIEQLEWIVNAYTLTFAVFLLTGAALGDRFGRKRHVHHRRRRSSPLRPRRPRSRRRPTGSSRRASVQGLGGAIVTPLTLTHPQRGRRARDSAASRSVRGRASRGSPSRWARSSAARSSMASRGSGSSGSTSPSGSSCSRSRRSSASRTGPDKALDLPGLALGERGPARDRLGPH